MPIPHISPARIPIFEPPRDPDDLRVKHLIIPYGEPRSGKEDALGLIGVGSDLGVTNGGGREGARLGPEAIRGELRRYGAAYDFESEADLSTLSIIDVGDLNVDPDSIEVTHRRLSEAVEAMLAERIFPIVLGGGHDLTFAGVRGLAKASQEALGGIAIDAHFDVREAREGQISSGTPFRRILEELSVPGERFVEIGANGCVNARIHFDYLMGKKARIFSLSETREKGMREVFAKALQTIAHQTQGIFVSFDLDSVAQAFAPGVSAPSPEGLTPREITDAAYLAGLEPKLRYLDIMELNPNFDQDNRTARLAVAILHAFFSGRVRRNALQARERIGFRPAGDLH